MVARTVTGNSFGKQIGRADDPNLLTLKQSNTFRVLIDRMFERLGTYKNVYDFCGIKNRDQALSGTGEGKYKGRIAAATAKEILNGFNRIKSLTDKQLKEMYDTSPAGSRRYITAVLIKKGYSVSEFIAIAGIPLGTYNDNANPGSCRFDGLAKLADGLPDKKQQTDM